MQKINTIRKELILMFIVVLVSEMMYLKDVELSFCNAGLGDNIIYLFNGMEIFRLESDEFRIPIMFFLNQTVLSYVIIKSSDSEMKQIDIQRLIRTGSRRKWWILKNIYIVKIILTFFFAKVGLAVFVSIMNGNLKLEYNKQFLEKTCNIFIDAHSPLLCVATAVFIPLLTSIVLGMCLLLFAFIIRSYYCYIGMMIFLVFSVFCYNKWFIGEYLFWGRSILADKEGYQLWYPVVINLIVFIGIIKSGIVYIQKYDFSIKQREES